MGATLLDWLKRPSPAEWGLLAVLVLIVPAFASDFWLVQVFARSMILGLIALGLTFLAGFAGIVSLAQMTLAGVAAYTVAIFTTGDAWPGFTLDPAITIPLALLLAVLASVIVGWLAVRTTGIYTIMITLAIAVVFATFARQNYTLMGGFTGFTEVWAPTIGETSLRMPLPFYFTCLVVTVIGYWAIRHLSRTPLGLSLQGIRDGARRMASLGYHVHGHRILAYAIAGLIAGAGGILMVWFNQRIDPSTVDVMPVINILIIAVIGGLGHPIGAFIGAFIFVLLDIFAADLIPGARERFNLLIGLIFLLIVAFSRDGIVGIWQSYARAMREREPDD